MKSNVRKLTYDLSTKFLFYILVLPLLSPNSCNLKIKREYYIDRSTNCTSTRRLRITKCSGICQSLLNNRTLTSCCKPIEPKRRYFQMSCATGINYRQSLDFFTKCKCLLI